MPCKRGYREQLEEAKRRREEESKFEREYEQSEEGRFWQRLRATAWNDGLSELPAPEQTYFALWCFIGEVHNGGLHQFFFNSSGSMYGVAADGLLEVGAYDAAALLSRAKDLLFGTSPVPVDTARRRAILSKRGSPPELEELDQAFWRSQEKLEERCRQYATEQRLWPGA